MITRYKIIAGIATLSVLSSLAVAQIGDDSEYALQDNFANQTFTNDHLGYHNKMTDSSNQLEPGAETERNWNLTDVFGSGYRVYDSRDSTPGPDNWGLSKYRNASIGNRGDPYRPGNADRQGCYYQPNLVHSSTGERENLMEEGVDKRDKVFGNSFANARDIDGDGTVEGVWDDPDEWSRDGTGNRYIQNNFMNFTYCDITGYDKGIGVDNGTNDEGVFRFKNDDTDTNVSIGDIAFVDEDGKSDTFSQEPNVCGDDHKEYLIEELGESSNSMNRSGSYACSGRREVCVARHGGTNAVYHQGDLVETDEASEDFGRSKQDKEFCETQSTDTRFGVWYDQDYSNEYCQNNDLYGNLAVRWINTSFIDTHPYAVIEGLDDDLNPYLYNRNNDNYTSTQGNVNYGLGETPVPTGKESSIGSTKYNNYYSQYTNDNPHDHRNRVATKGFCGGDDSDEHIIVQKSETSLLDTNYSVIGVADDPNDCILDGANYPDKIDQSEPTANRTVYSTGDQVEVDLGPTQRQVTCFGGSWREDYPIVFQKDSLEIEEGNTGTAEFLVINPQSTETEYNIELDVSSRLSSHAEFSQGGDQFTVTVPAESSETHSVDVFGINTSINSEIVNVTGDAAGPSIQGSDQINVNVVDVIGDSVSNRTQTTNEVPGVGFIQILVMMILAASIYYTKII